MMVASLQVNNLTTLHLAINDLTFNKYLLDKNAYKVLIEFLF